jgi:hypothetical protein
MLSTVYLIVYYCTFATMCVLQYHTHTHIYIGLSLRPLPPGEDSRRKAAAAALTRRGPGVEEVLVTTADSRLRLYQTESFGMRTKYKGHENLTLQLRARCVTLQLLLAIW